MRILAVSDEEEKSFYDYYVPGKLDGYDLIISCGDLEREYLEFLATMSHCPVLYVPGNHDAGFQARPPEGCVNIDGRVFVWEGVRIAGLGGCYKYRTGPYLYTEGEMRRRALLLRLRLWRSRGVDILVTHAPPRGIHDLDNRAHRGFACFRALIERYAPRYMLHGHVHRSYGRNLPRQTRHGETTVVNACGHAVLEWKE